MKLYEAICMGIFALAYGWELFAWGKRRRARRVIEQEFLRCDEKTPAPARCFVTLSGVIAEEVRDGKSIALAVVFYEPGADRLCMRSLAGRTNSEFTALLSKFGIHSEAAE